MTSRLTNRFAALRTQNRAALIAYVMADDPDPDGSLAILRALPQAGADIIELGFPFTDPMADGPAIQRAGLRSLKSGGSLKRTLALLARFRETDADTPVILMGYANPIETMGYSAFAAQAKAAGADGLIAVDIPPEEDSPLRAALQNENIALIRMATPTTDAARLPKILEGASGFVYYVSVTGVTGAKAIGPDAARLAVQRIKRATDLPVAVGFGVREPDQARAIAEVADAVVVGSAFVDEIAKTIDAGRIQDAPQSVAQKVKSLADAVHGAARTAQQEGARA
ncbi:MAG: tryptophan synthase subunit alpha [Alphaproteobacteria bacterium]|nr:tryptophan synthase subunit alpha [Alphaproteobacteria bacterium]